MNIITQKIKEGKSKKPLFFQKYDYIKNIKSLTQIANLFNINTATVKKWSWQMEFSQKIKNVTIDRALRELIFTSKEQIICFEFLKKDYNYFLNYDEVSKHMNISRYFFKSVKNYIKEELTESN